MIIESRGTDWTASRGCDKRARVVLPRDRSAAALSYDGRESAGDLREPGDPRPHGLAAVARREPTRSAAEPRISRWLRPTTWRGYGAYQVDRSAVLLAETSMFTYGLFGHDFEKGVVFRARLRGLLDCSGRRVSVMSETVVSAFPGRTASSGPVTPGHGAGLSPSPVPLARARRQVTLQRSWPVRGSSVGSGSLRRRLPGAQLLQVGTGELDLKFDRVFQLGLDVQVVDLAADRSLESIGEVAAGKRLLDSGLGPLAGQYGPETGRSTAS